MDTTSTFFFRFFEKSFCEIFGIFLSGEFSTAESDESAIVSFGESIGLISLISDAESCSLAD